ncbi:sensor domain-containing diguanylate cyclase [Phreatobacter sp.]|uniref:sensor domain-containing diguanylate cyclase n=1 Tax=Phreatobacter sp. TaxID=1966341 RepID=UPI0025FC188C|nr:sensor domain-containing diguanylate cyclase [Phreatobacter sp.]
MTRWLAGAPAGTPDVIRHRLIAEMFGSLPVFFGGLLATLISPVVVAFYDPRPAFLIWLGIELLVGVSRLAVLVHSMRAAPRGEPTFTNLNIMLALAWGGSLGFGVFFAMTSGDWIVATLVAVPTVAMVGGMCFRNFAAPRIATAMMMLSLLPTSAGAILSGEPVMTLIAVLVPMYLLSMTMAAFKLNRMLVSTMLAEHENRHRASHDELTGLGNRGRLVTGMQALLGRRRQTGFAVFYLDLDGFKQVNDTRGHAAGDRILQQVAEVIDRSVRSGDVTARIGGDEFVVLADSLTTEEALAFGRRLSTRISGLYDLDGGACRIGVSIGIACAPQHGADIPSLLAAADEALYAAKAEGRSAVRMASMQDAGEAAPLVPSDGVSPLGSPVTGATA